VDAGANAPHTPSASAVSAALAAAGVVGPAPPEQEDAPATELDVLEAGDVEGPPPATDEPVAAPVPDPPPKRRIARSMSEVRFFIGDIEPRRRRQGRRRPRPAGRRRLDR
jgi:hypothetical protein